MPGSAWSTSISNWSARSRVIENLRLACARRAGWKSQAQAVKAMAMLSAQLGFHLNPHSRVDELAVSDQQKLEIMKVLLAGAKILILDEPTAVLTEAEAQATLSLARHARAEWPRGGADHP